MGADDDKLLDPKFMDGPSVKWTVADLFKSDPKLFMKYHVTSSGFHAATPFGCLLGGVLYGAGVRRLPTALAMMGTGGIVAGCGGMILGYSMMSKIATKGENASPPWTDDGIQNRVDGLSHNFKARVLDLSAWSGTGLAAGALAVAGGPAKLGLSAGALGVLQALTLGSTLGSLGAFGCIYSMLPKKSDRDDE
jgi:hypothetical protein